MTQRRSAPAPPGGSSTPGTGLALGAGLASALAAALVVPASPPPAGGGPAHAAAVSPADTLPDSARGRGATPSPLPDSASWRMPPMETSMPMVPSVTRLRPDAEPFLPGERADPSALPAAGPREVRRLTDGDSLVLEAGLVRRTLRGRTFVMYGYNGQYPGPLLRVPQGATITVRFVNRIDMPSTVHWHGVRLDNRFDGVPEVTQEPVEPGEAFTYRVHFEDAGVYWYHPHLREDVQQDLGLYGNVLVEPADSAYGPSSASGSGTARPGDYGGYFGPAHREEVLMLDDLLVDEQGLYPFGEEAATHTLMGRFGNVLLVNGRPDWSAEVKRGSVVRFYLTNVSNTRIFNLTMGDTPLQVVAADISRFERERSVDHVVVAPAQRYVVEAHFDEPGTVALTNRIQAMDHYRGAFYPRVDTLGLVHVTEERVTESHAEAFRELRSNPGITRSVEPYREALGRPPDRRLTLTVEGKGLPLVLRQMMGIDTLYAAPVEWNDAMPMMNYVSTSRRLTWILRDEETGRENMQIDWSFEVGDRVKIRLFNDPESLHPMQHPIHVHGQRFLVLARDGVPSDNLVWKDTVLVPVGSTVDILLEVTNPGDWMAHCHISEHLEAGMMTTIHVDSAGAGGASGAR